MNRLVLVSLALVGILAIGYWPAVPEHEGASLKIDVEDRPTTQVVAMEDVERELPLLVPYLEQARLHGVTAITDHEEWGAVLRFLRAHLDAEPDAVRIGDTTYVFSVSGE